MRFLVDAQLPPALARFLEKNGHEASHVEDIGLRHASDSEIWEKAHATDAIIVTKDEDFAIKVEMNSTGPAVVWIRKGNCINRILLGWFEPLLPKVEKALMEGNRLVEVI